MAAYTITEFDGDVGADVTRVCILNPWRQTSAPGALPKVYTSEHPLRLPGESDDDLVIRLANESVPVELVASVEIEGKPIRHMSKRDAARRGLVGKPIPYQLIDHVVLPPKSLFRGAWRLSAGVVVVDMAVARGIKKSELRGRATLARAKATDLINVADDKGDSASVAKLKKQRKDLASLDDAALDTRLAALTTPEALAAYVPPELNGLE